MPARLSQAAPGFLIVNVSSYWKFQGVFTEELVFGERTTVVVDPAEEKIKAEFNDVKRTYLPMHSVLRIDEVKKQGVSKIVALEGSNVSQFPVPIYTPGGDSSARK